MSKFVRTHGLLAVAVVALFAVSLGAPLSAAAHTREGKRPYWRMFTHKNQGGSPGKSLDPITIMWTRGPLAETTTQDHVKSVVSDYWTHGNFTFGQACLLQSKLGRRITDSSTQIAIFPARPGNFDPGDAPDETDYQGSTSPTCLSQWHMRFWDDVEHWQLTGGSGTSHVAAYQWAVSGVHHDISTRSVSLCYGVGITQKCGAVGAGHRVAGYWNSYRNLAVGRYMKGLCGRSRYRQYLGGGRMWRNHRYDGYYARVELARDESGCPRGLR